MDSWIVGGKVCLFDCIQLLSLILDTNYAHNKPTRQVSTYNGGFSGFAVDGNANNSGLFSKYVLYKRWDNRLKLLS